MRSTGDGDSTIRGGWAGTLVAVAAALTLTATGVVAGFEMPSAANALPCPDGSQTCGPQPTQDPGATQGNQGAPTTAPQAPQTTIPPNVDTGGPTAPTQGNGAFQGTVQAMPTPDNPNGCIVNCEPTAARPTPTGQAQPRQSPSAPTTGPTPLPTTSSLDTPQGAKPGDPSQDASRPTVIGDLEQQGVLRQSPLLRSQIESIRSKGWRILYSDGGSYTDPSSRTVFINRNDGARELSRTVSHEVMHAVRGEIPKRTPDDHLTDEGYSVLNEIRVRQEIVANGGRDVGFSFSENPAIANNWKLMVADVDAGLLTDQYAATVIGRHFGENAYVSTCPKIPTNYRDYYTTGCNK